MTSQAPMSRERMQNALGRWGSQPVIVAPEQVLVARRQRGISTLRAAMASAQKERRGRRWRIVGVAAAAAALLAWGSSASAPWRAWLVSAGLVSAGADGGSETSLTRPTGAEQLASSRALGTGEISSQNQPRQSVTPGRSLHGGDRIFAGAAPLTLDLAQTTRATLARQTILSIARLEPRLQELRVESGRANFEVDPGRSARVVVHTADARVLVTGTAFSVTAGRDGMRGWSEVAVQRGHVEVTFGRTVTVLHAGEHWTSRDSNPQGPVSPQGLASPQDSANPQSPANLQGAAKRQRTAEKNGTERNGSPEPTSSAPAATPSTTLAEENRLFRAALAERNAGSGTRCVRLLSELLGKYPGSPLRQEAMVAQFRCLRMTGSSAAAGRAAARYLAEYPNGFAKSEARDVVLLRDP